MLTVKECVNVKDCAKIAQQFSALYTSLDRAYVLYDDEPIGIAVLGLDKGVVVIKFISDCGSVANFDFLARSILLFVSEFNSIMVRADCHEEYFLNFGFSLKFNKPHIKNTQIKFSCKS